MPKYDLGVAVMCVCTLACPNLYTTISDKPKHRPATRRSLEASRGFVVNSISRIVLIRKGSVVRCLASANVISISIKCMMPSTHAMKGISHLDIAPLAKEPV